MLEKNRMCYTCAFSPFFIHIHVCTRKVIMSSSRNISLLTLVNYLFGWVDEIEEEDDDFFSHTSEMQTCETDGMIVDSVKMCLELKYFVG